MIKGRIDWRASLEGERATMVGRTATTSKLRSGGWHVEVRGDGITYVLRHWKPTRSRARRAAERALRRAGL